MSARNTPSSYGSVSRMLHWLTALLIIALFPLGMAANNMGYETADELALKATLFSAHKTVGVLLFFVALARVFWSLVQEGPRPLYPDRRVESFVAVLVHWMLYLSLIFVPLTGWAEHAASEGFAPIWWPFGQGLPLVPKSPELMELFAGLHWLLTKVMMVSILLHIAGAVKHAVFDRDDTMKRMGFRSHKLATPPAARHSAVPVVVAIVLYALAMGAVYMSAGSDAARGAAGPASAPGAWQVTEGALEFTVNQMGSEVTGHFETWDAAITFDEMQDPPGAVEVTINIASLRLGSVTKDVLVPEFFDPQSYPTAIFAADILRSGAGYVAQGTLTLRGAAVPVSMPFDLSIDGDIATMSGAVTLDRRDFGIGASYPDESMVGHAVNVAVRLSAQR
ncbi:MAG: cytochrome [Rhodobacterales bacterium]|nr:MAG: cytochrome [Rhodobacterales bacterium]